MNKKITIPEYTESCPNGVYEKIVMMNNISIGEFAREMEKATEEHLKKYNMDRKTLEENGLIWVVVCSEIHVLNVPKENESMILRTWPGKNKTSLQSRRYAFYSKAGEPLVIASSLFALMNKITRALDVDCEDRFNIEPVKLEQEFSLPKLSVSFPNELSSIVNRKVIQDEIDLNGHMNNTHYIDWADDLNNNEIPSYIWIQYVKELLLDQNVELHYSKEEEFLYLKGRTDEGDAFIIKEQF